jgi:hypothetical protein
MWLEVKELKIERNLQERVIRMRAFTSDTQEILELKLGFHTYIRRFHACIGFISFFRILFTI